MLIYIVQILLIIIFYILLSFKRMNNKKEKIFCIFTFMVLSLVACFRDVTVGYDTAQYVIAFKKSSILTLSTLSNLRYEYGFSFLCILLNKITSNPQILLITTSLFINYTVLNFIYKNSDNKLLSVLLYILLNTYFFYTSAMRQAIAISIILLGFDNVQSKKYIKFILYVVIASLFHQSAILALLFIFFREKKYNKTFIYELLIMFILFFIFGKNIFDLLVKFSPRLQDYSFSKFNVENYYGALLQFVLNFILFIIGYIVMLKNNKSILNDKSNKNNIYIGIMAASLIFYLLTMKVSIFNRFSPYFSIFIITWLPNCLSTLKRANDRLVIYVGIFSVLLMYWGIINYLRPEWYGMIPYSFFK